MRANARIVPHLRSSISGGNWDKLPLNAETAPTVCRTVERMSGITGLRT
jgi:hypothetical protein